MLGLGQVQILGLVQLFAEPVTRCTGPIPTADVLTLQLRRSTFGYPQTIQNGAPQSELGYQ